MFRFPRAVWLLGWVSLATDAATEAVYPLLPFFLTRVLGVGAVTLGIVEGTAEALNSVLKVFSGTLADRSRAKKPLVLAGYGLSSAARPFIAIASTWTQVFIVRLLDRVGKGVRGAPRDAMLAVWTTPTTRGRIYGFHQAMDHVGAVIGPIAASLFLLVFPDQYRMLFALTIIPGAIAVLLILAVPEDGAAGHEQATPPATSPKRTRQHGSAVLPGSFTAFMIVLAIFTLGNSTDAFLLLRLTDAAGGARLIPLFWSALHVVKATMSFLGGSWSDRIGRRRVMAMGWLVYAAVYAGFAFSESLIALVTWFLIYGLYFGLTEGTGKALVADLAPPERRGFAFGVFAAVQGVGALAASVLFGLLWNRFGTAVAFGTGAGLAFAATVGLFAVVPAGDSRDV